MKMLDKLVLATDQAISFDRIYESLEGAFAFYQKTATRYHNSVYVFHRGPKRPDDHLVSVHCDPRSTGIGATKVELNPTRFKAFGDLESLLGKFLDLNQLVVSRLDHAVDISVPVDTVRASLIFSRKKSREVYKQGHNCTGFYLGSYPEQLAVYDRGMRVAREPGQITRIELRQHREKIPVRKFTDLPSLKTYKPFARLEFQAVRTDLSLRESQKAKFLEQLMSEHGAQGAFKKCNQHSNFKRDFSGCLARPDNIPDLDSMYQTNLSTFFGGALVH